MFTTTQKRFTADAGGQQTGQGTPFDEIEEMELAAQLLEVSDEKELDQFLGDLISRAANTVGSVIRSPVGQAVGGLLKDAAGKLLPMAGQAIGTYIGGPTGGQIGGQIASAAGRAFGLELEGMSGEDQEFEVARRFVRFAGAAAQRATAAPEGASPEEAARAAIIAAARRFAPGLLSAGSKQQAEVGNGQSKTGRWIRRGRRVILLDV